jgi:hypothetical protein
MSQQNERKFQLITTVMTPLGMNLMHRMCLVFMYIYIFSFQVEKFGEMKRDPPFKIILSYAYRFR